MEVAEKMAKLMMSWCSSPWLEIFHHCPLEVPAGTVCSLTVIKHPQNSRCRTVKLLETLGRLPLYLSRGAGKANKSARLTFDPFLVDSGS